MTATETSTMTPGLIVAGERYRLTTGALDSWGIPRGAEVTIAGSEPIWLYEDGDKDVVMITTRPADAATRITRADHNPAGDVLWVPIHSLEPVDALATLRRALAGTPKDESVDPAALSERISELEASLAQERDRNENLSKTLARRDSWVDDLVEKAHEEADNRGWCDEFDDFMENVGLPRRSKEYTVEVDVTVRVSVSVTATTEEEALEEGEQEARREVDYSSLDGSIESVDAAGAYSN